MTDHHVTVPSVSIKRKRLELRTGDIHLTSQGEHVTAKILRWVTCKGEKPYCYTLAYWLCDSEGYYLHFVGRRPLDKTVNWEAFSELVRTGQDWLDKAWKKAIRDRRRQNTMR